MEQLNSNCLYINELPHQAFSRIISFLGETDKKILLIVSKWFLSQILGEEQRSCIQNFNKFKAIILKFNKEIDDSTEISNLLTQFETAYCYSEIAKISNKMYLALGKILMSSESQEIGLSEDSQEIESSEDSQDSQEIELNQESLPCLAPLEDTSDYQNPFFMVLFQGDKDHFEFVYNHYLKIIEMNIKECLDRGDDMGDEEILRAHLSYQHLFLIAAMKLNKDAAIIESILEKTILTISLYATKESMLVEIANLVEELQFLNGWEEVMKKLNDIVSKNEKFKILLQEKLSELIGEVWKNNLRYF